MTTTTNTIGTINNNDNTGRIELWLEDGRIMADRDNPHIAHEDAFETIDAARAAAETAWSGDDWDLDLA